MPIRGCLIDLDGTIYSAGTIIEGAVAAIEQLRAAGYQLLFLTNTDSQLPATLAAKLQARQIPIQAHEIMNPLQAIAEYLSNREPNLYILAPQAVKTWFEQQYPPQPDQPISHVVLAHCGEVDGYNSLNLAFRQLLQGAEFLVSQPGRNYLSSTGLNLDTGAFAALLEYASQTKPTILGKPTKAFFEQALHALQLSAEEVVVVGDDLTTDMVGAANSGMASVWLRTGKGQQQQLTADLPQPTWTLASIAELPALLAEVNG
ncbi:HAD-IIA family hydrolase [Herpetosiphon giganteus]|uniref:HAD-IIA family hydrolase n=1 Tax=Herpetosiphon giganteus TaxID=2029754 RepID=UPI00195C925F|nr:HAD-IIA family hydrolase [Herpetosiphon giganteus]MBM7842486.1 HAD superfamily hydrolase (TIGR01458 family) [Herpetosiphon giganteus]